MRTIGAIPKEEVKEVVDLKEVVPNNSFYDSKEKEPIREVKPKVKKKK